MPSKTDQDRTMSAFAYIVLMVVIGVFLATGLNYYIQQSNDLPAFVSEVLFPASIPYLALLFLFSIAAVLLIVMLVKRKD